MSCFWPNFVISFFKDWTIFQWSLFILFNSLIIQWFTTTGFYNIQYINKVLLAPFLLSHLKSTQATWYSTLSREIVWNRDVLPSSLLSDVDKPTVWLEPIIVDIYGWALPICICAEQLDWITPRSYSLFCTYWFNQDSRNYHSITNFSRSINAENWKKLLPRAGFKLTTSRSLSQCENYLTTATPWFCYFFLTLTLYPPIHSCIYPSKTKHKLRFVSNVIFTFYPQEFYIWHYIILL